MPIATELGFEVTGVTNYLNTLAAVDAQVRFQIHDNLRTGLAPGVLPNYSVITPTQKTALDGIVDAAYNITNPLHPLNGVIPAAVANNFNRRLLNDIVLSYAADAKRAIVSGNPTFINDIDALGERSRNDLAQRLWSIGAEQVLTTTVDTLADIKTYLNITYAGIPAGVMGLITDKSQLKEVFALDIARQQAGARVTVKQIQQAILRGVSP